MTAAVGAREGVDEWSVRAPASSANLGAGFDVFGMALSLHAEVGCGDPPPGAQPAGERHPATVAYLRAGGDGPIWVRTSIPMARGLGFSGAVRVAGAATALVRTDGPEALDAPSAKEQVLAVASDLEQHADNAAASVYGGVVIAVHGHVLPVPVALDPAVVVWVPDSGTTSTERSRAALPETVTRDDAVFNIGRAAALVAALAAGDVETLRWATEDRLHQPARFAQSPASAAAVEAAIAGGAWGAWLSGSGPTVAMLCAADEAADLAARLPDGGHTKVLSIDQTGVTASVTGAAG